MPAYHPIRTNGVYIQHPNSKCEKKCTRAVRTNGESLSRFLEALLTGCPERQLDRLKPKVTAFWTI
jgi:hypothetical protein